MRIDYIVDTYSRNYPKRPDTNDQKKQVEAPPKKTAEKTQLNSFIKNDSIKRSADDDIKVAKSFVSEGADKVLDIKEKQMLAQLFPPGLFGAGIRAYKNYSTNAEEVPKVGNRIDVRQ